MLATSLLSLILFALAGVLLDAHRRDRRRADHDPTDAVTHRFARSRFSRRCFASGLIAVVAAFVAVWPITPREPLWIASYTAGLLTLALLIFLLGVTDAWASGRFYQAESRRRLTDHAEALKEALRQHQDTCGSSTDNEAGRV